jgi:hypothetical protein
VKEFRVFASKDGVSIMYDIMNALKDTRIIIKNGNIELRGAIAIIAVLLILVFAKDLIPLIFRP